jgi:hypothetical protein
MVVALVWRVLPMRSVVARSAGERRNDIYCLRRLDADEVNELLQKNVWPSDFDRYESLLRLGHG